MAVAYPILPEATSIFRAAKDNFSELVTRAGSEEWRHLTHDEVEQRIDDEGREVLRRLLEGHLILRGTGQVEEVVTGSDGMIRPCERTSSRQLGTVLGTVSLVRAGYSAPGTTNLFVVDADLNLPVDKPR